MKLFPFFSLPISRDELKELSERINLFLSDEINDREKNITEQTGKPFTLGRTEHVKIDLVPASNDVYNLGFLHNIATPVLSHSEIEKIFKNNKSLFDEADFEVRDTIIDSNTHNPSE